MIPSRHLLPSATGTAFTAAHCLNTVKVHPTASLRTSGNIRDSRIAFPYTSHSNAILTHILSGSFRTFISTAPQPTRQVHRMLRVKHGHGTNEECEAGSTLTCVSCVNRISVFWLQKKEGEKLPKQISLQLKGLSRLLLKARAALFVNSSLALFVLQSSSAAK